MGKQSGLRAVESRAKNQRFRWQTEAEVVNKQLLAEAFPSRFECQGQTRNERVKGRASFRAKVQGYSSHQQSLDFLAQDLQAMIHIINTNINS